MRDPRDGTIFDEWVFGGPGGSLTHAVRRQGGRGTNALGGYIVVSLCPANGSIHRGARATNTIYDPAAAPAYMRLCQECVRRFTAFHTEAPVWDRACATCRTDKPITYFSTDKRTTDGISKTCIECVQAKREVLKTATKMLKDAAEFEQAQERAAGYHENELADLVIFQKSSLTPTFTCTAGHVLAPTSGVRISSSVVGRWKGASWPQVHLTCPCGTVRDADVEGLDWTAVSSAVEAIKNILAVPAPEPVAVAGAGSAESGESAA